MNSNMYISENKTTAKLSVSSKSKKIQKAASPSKKSSSANYNTFDSSEKKAIIMDLKKSLSKIRSIQTNCSSEELLQVLAKVHKNDFNTVLKSSLANHYPTFDNSTEGLRIWRRRVKDWLKALDKPEGRGTFLVPTEKLEEFKMLLISALKSFTYRSLKQLRHALYHIFNKIGKPLSDKNTCSKHWWYDFLKANADVRNAWESLAKRAGAGVEASEEDNDEWTTTETFTGSPVTMVNNYECSPSPAYEETNNNTCIMSNFQIDEFDGFNMLAQQRSICRDPSLGGWEKFIRKESFDSSSTADLITFEKQISEFNTFLNPNAYEF